MTTSAHRAAAARRPFASRGPARQGIARHGRLHVTSAGASVGKFLGMSALVLALAGLILGGIAYTKLMTGIEQIPDDPEAAPVAPVEQQIGGVNVLLVGSDDRTGQGEEFGEGQSDAEGRLNDVNMVIHIAQDLSHAEVVSIPRDTIIDTAACTDEDGDPVGERFNVPINSILMEGGMGCVAKTIEEISGLDIHYSAMVKFRGVIAMSNAVGGVPVCVEEDIEDGYVGLDLPAGEHYLQGEDALKFLRTRHGVGDGSDLARISNQQVFLSSLIRTIKSSDTLTDPTKLYGLAYAVTQNMALSQSLNDIGTLTAMASAVAKIPTENISFISLPVAAAYDYPGKVVPSDPDAEVLWSMIREDRSFAQEVPANPSPTTGAAPTEGPDASSEEPTATEDSATGSGTASPTPSPTFSGDEVQHLNADQVTCANSSN